MTRLTVISAGPGITVQDGGRPGHIALGLSRGGAADREALLTAAALLGRSVKAAIELPGSPLTVSSDTPVRIALTGSPMRADRDGDPLAWSSSHTLAAGATLRLSPAHGGFGYLSFGADIDTPPVMGSRSAHLACGIGASLGSGATLPLCEDPGGPVDRTLRMDHLPRPLRVLPGAHTRLFPDAMRARFEATEFTRDPRGNRQGIRLAHEGKAFALNEGLSLVSEIARPGDIQMTGDGTPYLLGPECQTTGGYPRIGSVAPQDLPRAMRAGPGTRLRFAFTTRKDAMADYLDDGALLALLTRRVEPLTRDPRDVANLAEYQLISGVTTGAPA